MQELVINTNYGQVLIKTAKMAVNSNTIDTTSFLRRQESVKLDCYCKRDSCLRRNDALRGTSKGHISIMLTIELLY